MEPKPEKKTQKTGRRGFRHLTPPEVVAISQAFGRGIPASRIATEHGICRQTVYNAVRAVKKGLVEPTVDGCPIPRRRRRTRKIPPATKREIVAMKVKYPRWGAAYIREEWLRHGNEPISLSSIYQILREAGVNAPKEAQDARYTRFEMTRPGQLYQMDIQGKLFVENVGWIHGFALIDDYSRFVPAMRYFTGETMTSAILTLHEAIERHGIPEAIYVDNGTQFRSRGRRMNNFELYCSALGIQLVAQSPYRPQGKGKIERFFLTVEKQFISWAREQARADPHYTLGLLNEGLQEWLARYNERVHGGTKERPVDRFAQGALAAPDPPFDATPFLERSHERKVNKFGEVSYDGFKIQVDLPARSRVVVVETVESLRVEHGNRLVREVDKHLLSKETPLKRQNGVAAGTPAPGKKPPAQAAASTPHGSRHPRDEKGYYHRRIYKNGGVKVDGVYYYVGTDLASTEVLVRLVSGALHVFDRDENLLRKVPRRAGRRYK